MPCDQRDISQREQKVRDELDCKINKIAEVRNQNIKLEAILCAIFNELKRSNAIDVVISNASRSGHIDINAFWLEHQAADRAQLKADLGKYSDDERAILLSILEEDMEGG